MRRQDNWLISWLIIRLICVSAGFDNVIHTQIFWLYVLFQFGTSSIISGLFVIIVHIDMLEKEWGLFVQFYKIFENKCFMETLLKTYLAKYQFYWFIQEVINKIWMCFAISNISLCCREIFVLVIGCSSIHFQIIGFN